MQRHVSTPVTELNLLWGMRRKHIFEGRAALQEHAGMLMTLARSPLCNLDRPRVLRRRVASNGPHPFILYVLPRYSIEWVKVSVGVYGPYTSPQRREAE